MRIAIVANPLAGRERARQTGKLVQQKLSQSGADFTYLETEYAGHAISLAAAAARDHTIVAGLGGDGTIREVIEGIWQSQAVLGVIPAGTGNDHARGLGISKDPLAAVDTLLHGRSVAMDVGREDDAFFGCVGAVGFPVDVLEYLNSGESSRSVGKIAYLSAIAKTLRYLKPHSVTLTVDDQEHSVNAVGVLVMNMPFAGGGLQFAPASRYNDGLFHVVVVGRISSFQLLKTLPKVYKGNHVNHPAVTIFKGQRIQINPAGMKKMFDGDVKSETPFRAEIIPSGIRVMIPK